MYLPPSVCLLVLTFYVCWCGWASHSSLLLHLIRSRLGSTVVGRNGEDVTPWLHVAAPVERDCRILSRAGTNILHPSWMRRCRSTAPLAAAVMQSRRCRSTAPLLAPQVQLHCIPPSGAGADLLHTPRRLVFRNSPCRLPVPVADCP
jgi:hypothetical protein